MSDWHETHKNDSNIVDARRRANKARYERLKNDPEFIERRRQSMKKWRDENKDTMLKGRREYYDANPEYGVMDGIKRRAKKYGVPCNLTAKYIRSITPDVCPVLNIPLIRSTEITDNSPTVDRIFPSKGYVKDNVIVVSNLANRIKTNATPAQILQVAQFYENLITQIDEGVPALPLE